ncbi:uncharacterized protein LOC114736960 [Neltuma alba]|uniref:uncharacterized protein LOC114736960 n=1 Tax=Neltuma alba TaxID=207710 RepID=UPI0010A443B2|nr:uncharacterized protein LOC114736960 [Prosopis alba]XP_028780674.1 uncharacterized protein LOC114736960 [Prosopis alba]
MRGNIGFGTRLPNTNISHARQTLVPYSTFSNSGAGGRGRGRGSGSPLTSEQALGKPDFNESKSDSPESPIPPGSGPSGLGHGRGKPLPPPSSGRPSFSSFLSSLKPQSTGRGQVTSQPLSQPTNDSGPKKPMFFKRDDSSSPTTETKPISSIGNREASNKLLGNMAGVLSGLGRGKPMKQTDPENQVKEENRHLRAPQTSDATASKTVSKSQAALSREDAVRNARQILSQVTDKGGATGRGRGQFAAGPGQGRGQGRGRDGRERFRGRDRGERDGRDQRIDTSSAGVYFEDPDDSGEKLAEKVGPEVMNQLVEGFEELADTVLPSPLYDEYLDALDINCAIEFEPEYLMGEFDRNPDIDEKPPIPLRDALEKVKPFLMVYEGIKSQEEWEEIMEETMASVPLLKKIVDHYSGPDRVTAKTQQEELERVAKTLPQNAPSSVKQFTDRAVLSLQSNPGWGYDKKCQFMDKLVWEVSQHYK